MRVERCFAFVDLCGFTAFTERYGDEYTVVVLASFRTTLREVAARRGVRITKWLGDGAMLSSPDTEPTVAMVLEIAAHADTMLVLPYPSPVLSAGADGSSEDRLAIRAGLARGPVIMFEGDDYIGSATNIASRLCDAATPGQVLATREVAALAPRWVAASEAFPYPVRGFNKPIEAVRLAAGSSATMVVDPTCGLALPQVSGLITRSRADRTVEYFCSTACAIGWEQAQRAAVIGFPFPD
ncbi:MAG TPA: adenylate/guanylate cyclase domain-containing protein [Acidimicrobiales bacterium]|nr:adenylate/guanylate cyclase domain-containing protein [Acidimicrobiales bacterium]